MIAISIATIVGAIVYFISGWLVFEVLLGRFMAAHMTDAPGFLKTDEEASMGWIFVSCLAYAFMLTVLFTQWTNTIDLFEGLLIGGFIGGAISIMTSTYWYGSSHLFKNVKPIIADFCAAVLTVGCMGGVIAVTLLFV